jgi:thiol-disulfide isomerase/thioredoxin
VHKYIQIFVLFFLTFSISFGQNFSSIAFYDISLDRALELAKEQKKNVFIDAYADWCIPCKKMDQELNQKNIAEFFNSNYINVKINVEKSVHATKYRKEFDVIFLPTIILLSPTGIVKYKTDKYMDAYDLMDIASKSMQENVFYFSDATGINRDPMGSSSSVAKTGSEKIVHVLGSSSQNPEMLKKEAYFRIELMDGSHWKAAEKFLNTQTDWSLRSNMSFILDFVYDTKSPYFDYLVRNLPTFKKEFGEERIHQTLSYLINDELENSFPRPNFSKTRFLLSLLDQENAELNTYQYFLKQHSDDCSNPTLYQLASEYVSKFSPRDDIIYSIIGATCIEANNTFASIDDCITSTMKAVNINGNVPSYYEQLAHLYLQKEDKNLALKYIKKARSVAKKLNHNTDFYSSIEKKITSL